ncbi:YeaL [Pantoea ananatis LMG 20103]|jgi:uncharacterized membrane protein (DUF441 family)|uniref:UPF0756 membrane protein PANA_3507 n=3 Tax=Pantoea ananas TaxID=553 RepID=D4GNW9_PANAM|nr:YeaL [Pantoea ananatis LMG 20103]PKC47891.1 membrane protein [Pantoea ananatis BRT98]BAK12815.1 hypothetical protein YeaL [Pantoea ananatis AJ13355]
MSVRCWLFANVVFYLQGKIMAAYASTLILIGLAILSYFVHNTAVTLSILILLAIKLTPLAQFFPYVEKQGITIGIIILTVAVMAPLASGSLPASSLIKSFASWQSIVAVLVGIFVAWLGGRGVSYMSVQPSVIGGLLMGTVIGVAFFRGVPVGPLIAAGIVSLFITAK